MAEPILKLTRGVPKTDREWMDVFKNLTKFLRISGNELVIGGDISLPAQSVGTTELKLEAVTNDRLRDSAALSVMGRPQNTGGNPSDIISTVADSFMVRRGSALTWDVLADGDIPASIARDSEVSDAVAAHEAALDPHTQYTTAAELSTAIANFPDQTATESITGAWSFALPVGLPSFTVAGVPSAVTYANCMIYVSNETGGAVPAFSDGTNWRRVTDRAIVS